MATSSKPNKAAPPKRDASQLPPPPPPRSKPAPLRPAPEIAPRVSGVGTARVRWRGELESINREAEARERAEKRLAAGLPVDDPDALADDSENPVETVTRSAPPWLVSMVVHLLALLILALVTTPAGQGITRIMLEFGTSETPAPALDLEVFSVDTEITTNQMTEQTEDSLVDAPVPEIFENVETLEMSPIDKVEIGETSLKVSKPMFNGRTGAMKNALLAVYGGTKETQDAVQLGLQWLKRQQRSNGSWSMRGPYSDGGFTENQTAATAMALLAFLGDGNTHKSGPYAGVVDKGVKFLLSQQDRNGFMAANARDHERMYAQAQATIVLCELYAMTNDSWLRPRAQLAVEFAQDAQAQEGGWRYRPREDSDTSVTGWFVMALQSAIAGGLEVHESKLDRVNLYLDSASSFEGAGYSYQPRGAPSPAMTAEGILCRQYLKWTRDSPPQKRGIDALLLDAPFTIKDHDVYYWYYATQVMHHYGGQPWQEWNGAMRVQLPAAQVKSGGEAGSWAPQQDQWGRNSGRLYTTCLSIFCLEVYYRHMPLYKDVH
ncbi:prenyltransferase/squalene oxidase repeat-containing protein [Stieleria varia]|uniref:prenyltransferase/squalene oxidase repeat-containing protein n=1 Tax=Stieleria varia TaxID=2528005 RepID=UPI001E2A455C|nr:prenyltransferase/squalene oxidase repeat-containing protein [Stieleria varia]